MYICVFLYYSRADIALIGLAVMGQNIILNMNDHGFTVCAYNRTTAKVDEFLANEAKGTKVIGAKSIEEMVRVLKRPRRIMLLVKGKTDFTYCATHARVVLAWMDVTQSSYCGWN